MPLTVEDVIDLLFDEMDFEKLIGWADVLEVPHDEETWFKGEWLDRESELRVQVGAALTKLLEIK